MDRTSLREIEHDQWVPFLTEFSKAHFGDPVKVRVVGRSVGDADELAGGEPASPLLGIDDHADPSAGERIDVVTGAGRPVSYVVSHPVRVRVSDGSPGRPLFVRIDDRDGSATVVRFLTDPLARSADA